MSIQAINPFNPLLFVADRDLAIGDTRSDL